MSWLPWVTDRELDPLIAQKAIKGAFPAIDASSLTHLGSGWEFDAFATADRWVFRFPRRTEYESLFDGERPALALARKVLPAETAVPMVELVGRAPTDFPYPFAGHRLIEGVDADVVSPTLWHTMARSIAVALGGIHSVSADKAIAAGIRESKPPTDGARVWYERNLAGAARLAEANKAVAEAVDWVSHLADPLRGLHAPRCFIHGDLSPEHLIVSPVDGRLVGILDWTGASVGDAARDFVTIATFGGSPLVEAVLDSYPLPIDGGFRERLSFMSKFLSVMWLGESVLKAKDVEKGVAWVQNAFAPAS